MSGIKDYSLTPSSNTSINSIDISEGCPPSSINNAIRQEMADTRSFYESGGFVAWGHTCTYASGTSFTVAGDVTSVYVANRRLRAVGTGTGTIYGKVSSSIYSSPNTTVTVTWDSGSLSNEALTVSVGWVAPTGSPVYVPAGLSGPGSSTNGYVPQWSGTGGNTLSAGVMLDTDTTLAANSDTRIATQKAVRAYADAAGGSAAFKNLLINADFLNPVNQREYASGGATGGANQYTIDRWRVVTSGQNVSWSAGVVTAPAGGLEQVILGALIPRPGTYVISWTGTATCTVDGVSKTSGGTFTLTNNGTNSTVRFSGGTVQKPQVEYGSSATSFETLPYDVTLQRCLRFFEARGLGTNANQPFGAAAAFSTTVANAVVKFAPKRSTPTITYSAVGDFRISHAAGNSLSVTGISSGGGQTGLDEAIVQFSVSSGLTSLQACNIIGNSSAARLYFSAEL